MAWLLDDKVSRRLAKPRDQDDVAGAIEAKKPAPVRLGDFNAPSAATLARLRHVLWALRAALPGGANAANENDAGVLLDRRWIERQPFLADTKLASHLARNLFWI